jgi:hypothetical protein
MSQTWPHPDVSGAPTVTGELSSPSAGAEPGVDYTHRPVPRAWGWPVTGGGRAANVIPGSRFQATTTQVCGLFPFAVASGAAPSGVPLGIHQLTAEQVGLDPAEWLRCGLVSNTGMWIQAQPGIGKSALVKRLMTGLVAYGLTAVIPGDVKGEYSPLVSHLGGQVWRLGRGVHALNPLDASFLQAALDQSIGAERHRLEETIRSRRCSLLEALVTIVRRTCDVTVTERRLLSVALDVAVEGHRRAHTATNPQSEPTIPDVVRVLHDPPTELMDVVACDTRADFRRRSMELFNALQLLCDGAIRGMFDRPSSVQADLNTPALSLDISALDDDPDEVVAAAMLSSWAWAAAVIDASTAIGRRRNVFRIQDELWRALRVAPGLVERSDRVTRLGRHRGEVSAQITHSLDDLEALPTPEDRAKARGMASRNGILVLGGMAEKELDGLRRITPLTEQEAKLVTSWAAPPTWVRGHTHPGRGKYMIKSGERMGLPVSMTLTPTERFLYDTDGAWQTPAVAAQLAAVAAYAGQIAQAAAARELP